MCGRCVYMKAPYKTHIEGKNSLKAGGSVSYTGNPPGRREQNKNPTNTQKKIDEKMLNRRGLLYFDLASRNTARIKKGRSERRRRRSFSFCFIPSFYTLAVYTCVWQDNIFQEIPGAILSLSLYSPFAY